MKDIDDVIKDLSERHKGLATEMGSLMKGMDDADFIVLLDTIAVIETGPAKMLLREAAIRLARKVGN